MYYRLVVDSLKELDPKRKCFRMVGGVLVERTVGEVLPALNSNVVNVSWYVVHKCCYGDHLHVCVQMGETLEKLQVQLKEKGKALTEYREKNGIRFHGDKSEQEDKNADKSSHGILVGQ